MEDNINWITLIAVIFILRTSPLARTIVNPCTYKKQEILRTIITLVDL